MQKVKELARLGMKYGVFAWIAAAFVWYVIESTLQNGISCDEGYYLMGYLSNQSVQWVGTDFHAIVKAISRPFPDERIMVFRNIRVFLNGIAILLFAGSSYEWLSRKRSLQLSRWAYYPMVLLAGAMSFTFATPTISYDSLELILAMSAASFLFILFASGRNEVKAICAIGVGFLLWFACANYPSAGVCIVILFVAAYLLEIEEKKWSHLLSVLLGGLAAIIVSHFSWCIRS